MRPEQTAEFKVDTKAVVAEAGDGSGDLIIEGFASDFGEDRQDEAFMPGAFDATIEKFMENPLLCYHHDFSKALGQVEHLERRDGGLWMRARVDAPAPGSWAEDIFNKIERGTIKGLSVGGKFHRSIIGGKPRIHQADLIEISVTPAPVNPRTLFTAQRKAFDGKALPDAPEEELSEAELAEAGRSIAKLEAIFERVSQRLVTS